MWGRRVLDLRNVCTRLRKEKLWITVICQIWTSRISLVEREDIGRGLRIILEVSVLILWICLLFCFYHTHSIITVWLVIMEWLITFMITHECNECAIEGSRNIRHILEHSSTRLISCWNPYIRNGFLLSVSTNNKYDKYNKSRPSQQVIWAIMVEGENLYIGTLRSQTLFQ